MATTPSDKPKRERRKSTRIPVCIPVNVLGPGRVQSGTSLSLSTGGASLLVEDAFAVGELIKLEIKLPSGAFFATAEVVSARPDKPNQIGVRFERLDVEALSALHALVADKT